MSCPDIYLGPSYAEAPPNPSWTNPAIQPPPTFNVGTATSIGVTVRNHGTDDAPLTRLELFWSDPTTGFVAVPAWRIGYQDLPTIPGAVTLPVASDGEESHNFAWTPPPEAASTNGGHVCLLARVEMLSPPGSGCPTQAYQNDPPTDPRSAIRNIHVYASLPTPPGANGGGGKAGMAFAFAATNTLPHMEETELTIRPLDPADKEDGLALRRLIADPAVYQTLERRRLKFAVPKDLLVGIGRERVLVPEAAFARKVKLDRPIPQIQRLGPLQATFAEKAVLLPGEKLRSVPTGSRAMPLKLGRGERQQTLVHLAPTKDDDLVYAVNIEHRGADGSLIGGLVIVFVPPPTYGLMALSAKATKELTRSAPFEAKTTKEAARPSPTKATKATKATTATKATKATKAGSPRRSAS